MQDIIEQLNSLQVGDLVWWYEKYRQVTVIGIVTEMYPPPEGDDDSDYIWRADFPQDGEHFYWGECAQCYALDETLGIVEKTHLFS